MRLNAYEYIRIIHCVDSRFLHNLKSNASTTHLIRARTAFLYYKYASGSVQCNACAPSWYDENDVKIKQQFQACLELGT